MELEQLLPTNWKSAIDKWMEEDTPSFDYGGFVVGREKRKALLYIKSPGVLAGVPFFTEVFRKVACAVEWHFTEGQYLDPGTDGRIIVANVSGPCSSILLGERPALNMLARASGIATRARRLKELKSNYKWPGIIAATRKTTPGFRIVEKYACLVGGVDTHRMDLSSMIMLKDNHIWASGSITKAVQKARSAGGFALKIEVECQSLEEASEAIEAGADVVMLDNMNPEQISTCSQNLKSIHNKKNFLIEASGGLTEENCSAFFCPEVDILSFGSLTQSVPHVDFSLKIALE